ncbi:Paf1 [Plasmodiophora brassicae]
MSKRAAATPAKVQADGGSAPKKKRSQFMGDVDMRVELPEVPCDGKLLRMPVDMDRIVAFCASSLEVRTKTELFTEWDLSIPIEAIDPDAYALHPSGSTELHPDDELLVSLAKDLMKTGRSAITRRREQAQEAPVAKWFRKPEIMSSNLFATTAVAKRKDSIPEANGPAQKANANPDAISHRVEESFAVHRRRPVHATNKNLEAVSVLPVYPDLDLGKLKLSHVMFDRPVPIPPGKTRMDSSGLLVQAGEPQSRTKDLYTQSTGATSAYDWTARYTQTMPSTAPDSKDRVFFMVTPSSVLYGSLASRESLQKVTNVDQLTDDERLKIPSKIHLDLT